MEVDECFGCQVTRGEIRPEDGLFSVSPHWSFNQRVDTGARPWFVLQTKHHRNDVSDLSGDERDELGRLLPELSGAIEMFTGATRVYWAALNELGHVHIHLVPRFGDDDQLGLPLFDAPAPNSRAARVEPAVVRAIAEQATFDPGREPHAIVRAVVELAHRFDSHLSLYQLVRRRLWPGRWSVHNLAPAYVMMWAVILLALWGALAELSLPGWLRALIAFAAAYRWLDAVLYEIGILLDRSANLLVGLERSVLLAAANLVELSLIGAVWLVALEWGKAPGETWLHTFSLVTVSGTPDYVGVWASLAQVLTLAGGLVFIAGAVAMLVGAIGSRIREAA